MDSLSAFVMGEANRNKPLMVFDWVKAAKIIKEKDAKNVSAGLSGDWEWTGDDILENGEIPEDSSPYLASTWATPELCIDDEYIDCWKYKNETPDWDAETYWPEEAVKILLGI